MPHLKVDKTCDFDHYDAGGSRAEFSMMARLPFFLLVERHRVAAQISSRPPAAAMPGLSA